MNLSMGLTRLELQRFVRLFVNFVTRERKTILISSHILSEISLLADDIGIIDHGTLLEEESLAELEQKSSKHIRFTLSAYRTGSKNFGKLLSTKTIFLYRTTTIYVYTILIYQ